MTAARDAPPTVAPVRPLPSGRLLRACRLPNACGLGLEGVCDRRAKRGRDGWHATSPSRALRPQTSDWSGGPHPRHANEKEMRTDGG